MESNDKKIAADANPNDEQRSETVTTDTARLIETLQQENEALKGDNKKLSDGNKALKGELKSAKKATEAAEAENQLLTQLNETLTAQMEELSTAPSKEAATEGISKETFDVDGVAYMLPHAKIRYKKQRITITEVLASAELQRQLVDAAIAKPAD